MSDDDLRQYEPAAYDDDRPDCMRVHVLYERSRLAQDRYPYGALLEHARRHGVPGRYKDQLAENLTLAGHVGPDGELREGWPS